MDNSPSKTNKPSVPPPIRKLDDEVVHRIAAGEVIQRPASALKELIENSLDAGATSVSVVVKDGGLKLIQIVDNGHGIRVEDLPILCERHTTSKLRDFEDLQTINTLGFRGEALASISFVSHLTVTTMMEGQVHGYRATFKDGKMDGEARPCAAVKGTQITAENLFYNVVARRKAFKNPAEEYGRVLDIVSRFAVHNFGVSFSCKKHGDSRGDLHTLPSSIQLENIRSVYGPSVTRELVAIEASDNDPNRLVFKMKGFVSSANYSAKKTTMILFINDRMVECSVLKRACEAVYAAILPKASKPFIYLSIVLPSQDVDVNIHPTKREVGFLNQEAVVEAVQHAVEAKLLQSNTTRTFYTQMLIKGAAPSSLEQDEEVVPSRSQANNGGQPQKAPVNKLVRTDEGNPAGSMHAFLHPTTTRAKRNSGEADVEGELHNDLAVTRRAVRQRRNPAAAAELTSIQELLAEIDKQTHSGLQEIVKHNTYIGMADDELALLQYKTRLYLVNIISFSKELIYQQVLRRFGHFSPIHLSSPAPLAELLLVALDDEERADRWQEGDGSKEEIANLSVELLKCKAEMLREYFNIDIDDGGNLLALPLVLDHYTPNLDFLPQFILTLSNNVDWDTEKECFESVSAALAEFYALHPPLQNRPIRTKESRDSEQDNTEPNFVTTLGETALQCEDRTPAAELPVAAPLLPVEEAEDDEASLVWAQREWTIQHLLFPALKFFLKPPNHMANDGSAIQIACLENLYKIFERC